MAATLVLNATYEPLGIVPLRRALVLVLTAKAVVVETSDQRVHSARLSIPAPTVVRLSRFVRVPYRRTAALTRRAVLERDGHRCVYCERTADTIDHVQPRSRGGRNEWSNVVAACARCNHRKGDRLLTEIGWSLEVVPSEPPAAVSMLVGRTSREPIWDVYLGWSRHSGHASASAGGLSRGLLANP
jgi:5-methylcytosine-specific restriction endonuclease McrA